MVSRGERVDGEDNKLYSAAPSNSVHQMAGGDLDSSVYTGIVEAAGYEQ